MDIAQRNAFAERGYIVVHGALSARLLHELNEKLDIHITAWRKEVAEGTDAPLQPEELRPSTYGDKGVS